MNEIQTRSYYTIFNAQTYACTFKYSIDMFERRIIFGETLGKLLTEYRYKNSLCVSVECLSEVIKLLCEFKILLDNFCMFIYVSMSCNFELKVFITNNNCKIV